MRVAGILLALLLILPFAAASSQAHSTYEIGFDLMSGEVHSEGFSVPAGSDFGWEVWVYSHGQVAVRVMDDANHQLYLSGSAHECLAGPLVVDRLNHGEGSLTSPGGKLWVTVEVQGPGPVEATIILVDVPFFSTSFGALALLVLQAFGALIAMMVLLVSLYILHARLAGRRAEARSRRDRYRSDENPFEAADPLGDPYVRSRPWWRGKG